MREKLPTTLAFVGIGLVGAGAGELAIPSESGAWIYLSVGLFCAGCLLMVVGGIIQGKNRD